MTGPRVVLDTNVLLSALLFQAGTPSWLRHAWQSGTVRPLASSDTTAELIRVLTYPRFRLSAAEREDALADYLPWCEVAAVPRRTRVPPCRDPFDRPFLMLAAAAKAEALVTGDRDLLALADAFAVPILTPARFREGLPRPAR